MKRKFRILSSLFRAARRCLIAPVILAAFGNAGPASADEPLFASLETRLINDGLDADFVRSVYRHPSVQLEPHIISVNLQWKESTVNYNQFLKPKTVANAKAYLKTHCESLNAARERFGVSPQIIVAILTVETRLGTVTGTYPTINVLSTMAVADTPPVQERIFALLVPGETDAASREEVMRRLTARVGRGYRDLKAFLAYVRQQGKDPCIIKGSREGAIGIPQFIPSNITQYGHDGNNDGLIDLFDHDDAIASVARFLSLHRWNEDASVKEKKATLLRYNRSVYYVDAVYALARRLRRDKP